MHVNTEKQIMQSLMKRNIVARKTMNRCLGIDFYLGI